MNDLFVHNYFLFIFILQSFIMSTTVTLQFMQSECFCKHPVVKTESAVNAAGYFSNRADD